jgi:hypothetical protein
MKTPARQAVMAGIVAACVLGCATDQADQGYDSLEQALAAAVELGKPVLLDFYTEW